MVLMDLESGTYFGLNPVAVRIWQLLEETPQTLTEVRDQIVLEFDVSREIAERDLLALTSEMVERRLLVQDAAEES